MKITQEQKVKGQEFYRNLVTKAWEDATFKEELIKNPKAAIKNLKGEELILPDHTQIVVEDQTEETNIYLNIPRKVNLNDFELTDEELEIVAGGIVGLTVLICAEVIAIGYLTAEIMHQKRQMAKQK